MMELYDQTTFECSKLITQRYSTSFTLGIKTLDKKFHYPIYSIYGFVRYADEIVDTFHDFDKKLLLDKFRTDTYQAIERGLSLNPVLHSFQAIVNEYHIERELIDSFLYSMELDLTARGLGMRSKRYAMIVEDGNVTTLNVEDVPSEATVSNAENIIALL